MRCEVHAPSCLEAAVGQVRSSCPFYKDTQKRACKLGARRAAAIGKGFDTSGTETRSMLYS